MNYLQGIGLENFRVFKEKTFLNFAPLTVLTGANNSGKSTVLKALMLVAENFNNKQNKHPHMGGFSFNAKHHELLSAKNTVNKFSDNKDIKIYLPIELPIIKSKLIFFELVHHSDIDGQSLLDPSIFLGDELLYEVPKSSKGKWTKIGEKSDGYSYFDFKLFFENIHNYSKSDIKELSKGKATFSEFEKIMFSLIQLKDEILYHSDEFSKIQNHKFASEQPNKIEFSSEPANKRYFKYFEKFLNEKSTLPDIISFLNEILIKSYQGFLSNILYTHPEKQKRSYDKEDSDILNVIINKLIIEEKFSLEIQKKFNDGKQENNYRFYSFIDKWSVEFGINKIRPVYNSALNRNYIDINDGDNVMNYGLGTIQIINILLAIQTASSSAEMNLVTGRNDSVIVLIEEPESNLHPNYQSKLADLIIDAIKEFNIQFIIETHSEYFIRKLQYLTAKKKIEPENTIIHYFANKEGVEKGEQQVTEIKIKHNGGLSKDFGTGFMDEADNLSLDLFFPTNVKPTLLKISV